MPSQLQKPLRSTPNCANLRLSVIFGLPDTCSAEKNCQRWNEKFSKKRTMKTKNIFLLAFATILVIWTAYPFLISNAIVKPLLPNNNWAKLGTIGDSFGALNTLFSGLALAGLAVTISLQASELRKLQRKESETAALVSEQSKIMKVTALLHYLNNEIDFLERQSKDLGSDDEYLPDFWKRFETLRARREKIVAEINI